MLSNTFFISFIVLFSSRICLFCDVYLFVNFLILFLCYFLISLNCLSCFSCSLLNFFQTAIFNSLPGKLQKPMSLGLVTGTLFAILWWRHVSLIFFVFLEVLNFCLHIWSSTYHLQSLLINFRREIPSISPARDSRVFLKPFTDTPPPHFLLFPMAEFWSLHALSWSCNAQGWVLIASLLLFQEWC